MQTTADPEWMTAAETAEYMRLPLTSLYVLNSQGLAPPRYRIGKRVLYRKPEVANWMKDRRVETGQRSPAGK